MKVDKKTRIMRIFASSNYIRQQHIQIEVKGVVQGVGFRPFVYGLAKAHNLTGWVYNHGAGVSIAVQGKVAPGDALIAGLRVKAPPLAQITTVEVWNIHLRNTGFHDKGKQRLGGWDSPSTS